jgi:hypothetical protein
MQRVGLPYAIGLQEQDLVPLEPGAQLVEIGELLIAQAPLVIRAPKVRAAEIDCRLAGRSVAGNDDAMMSPRRALIRALASERDGYLSSTQVAQYPASLTPGTARTKWSRKVPMG